MLRTIMYRNPSRMAHLEVIILLCSMITFMASNCDTESENNGKKSNLLKAPLELDLSSADASIENEESLRKIVKRLAPEKNGVTGQPGVDFPALTTIPATSFSCRGLKGGYYADLETNCQVFHICDNGRKISFLCPNGTIFQQSQLICDWWFKVDCSKSTELYEQSSEQLLEEERRRAESRNSRLDYQHSAETSGQQDYYGAQNLGYDGKQNGRIKPYEEAPQENQLQSNRETIKPSRQFDQGSNARKDGNQLFPLNGFQSGQSTNSKQVNQFARNTEEGDVNGFPTGSQDYYSTPKKVPNYRVTNQRNSSPERDEKGGVKRSKFKSSSRSNSMSASSQRVTPVYTESTTFRAGNTNSAKEFQQFAESAAFVGGRGNRYNENLGNTHQYYYQLYINRETTTTRSPNFDSNSVTTWRPDVDNDPSTQRNEFFTTDTTPGTYETTQQYSRSATLPCNEDFATDSTVPPSPTTSFVTQPVTESLQFANSNYEYRGNARTPANLRTGFADRNYYGNNNNNNNQEGNRATAGNSLGTIPPTRSYVTTNSYRQTPVTTQQRYATSVSFRGNNFGAITSKSLTKNTIDNRSNTFHGDSKSISHTTASSGYRQNLISSTTEKPARTTFSGYQQNTSVTGKDLSPYDRSFTYKQGKVMSTLGPYVPFTRNYAYTTTVAASTTTEKPSPYTPTVPTYTTAYTSPRTTLTKLKYPVPTLLSKIKSSSTRLSEREHALSMLNSLKSLENEVPNLTEAPKGNNRVYNVSAPPAPSTLHSLALYFSTATENFDSREAMDSSIGSESFEEPDLSIGPGNGTVQVPTGLFTRNTLNSYAELFKLNDAVETDNVTTEDRLDNSDAYGEDYNEDLELQQSGGSLDELRKSNSSRLRELAQVFTHALSAYLLDPDTFKKVLTEIRPTEPPRYTEQEMDQWTTTPYSILEQNTLSTREKDEVLDFSDDNDIRQKLTTVYPTESSITTTDQGNVYDIVSTVPSNYYTTPKVSTEEFFEQTTQTQTHRGSPSTVTSPYFETSVPTTESIFTSEESSTYSPTGTEKGSFGQLVTDTYVVSDGSQKRVGGFQNNSVTAATESYNRGKSFATTPISENFVAPTPSSPALFAHMLTHDWDKKASNKKLEQQLSPPFHDIHSESHGARGRDDKIPGSLRLESYTSTPLSAHTIRATTFNPKTYETTTDQPSKVSHSKSLLSDAKLPTSRTSYMKFRNLYDRLIESNTEIAERSTSATVPATEPVTMTTTTISPETTPPCADSVESLKQKEQSKVSSNGYWSSSPAVTHLWETSVFVDPQRINQGLESDPIATASTGALFGSTDSQEYGNTATLNEDATSSSEESLLNTDLRSAQRLSRDKDSPTTFSLFPTSFTIANTVTPKPLITTRSSIITTVSSSVTSTDSLPQEDLVTSLLPGAIVTDKPNDSENEIAEKLFGKLNVSSTDTLMRVMKQADKNETVRQLVLLLIKHCNDPANKTMQQEKEELLNALLRLPVNEFSSVESKNVVAGINQLSLPATRSIGSVTDAPTTLPTEPPATTFRDRKSRKFRTTTENAASIVRRSEKEEGSSVKSNLLRKSEASLSDNRALELLRSLYTVAMKWG